MASSKSSSRYNSDPSSSSSEFTRNNSKALVRTKSSDPVSMVKKFIMEKRSKPPKAAAALFIPADFIAQDLKKTQKPAASNFSSFHRKLFHTHSDEKKNKALLMPLTEVKSNTRTLAMVLRSERELLNQNKDQETQIAELKLMLEDNNIQVDTLKDLCLKQREEIRHLKNAILFPDPTLTLERQVTSLTDQLQSLAHDLAQVKAKRAFFGNSPVTSVLDQEATNSVDFSCDETAPSSPDDIFFQDFNPCLTPYSAKSKSKKEIDEIRGYSFPQAAGSNSNQPHARNLSKSSEEYCKRRPSRTFPWSNDSTWHQLS